MAAGKGPSKSGKPSGDAPGASDADAAFEREAADEAAKLGYEDALERLEAIIERVEHGEIGLEESLREYRRGRALLKRCRSILDVAEQEIRRMTLSDVEAAANGESDSASGRSSR